MELGRRVLEEMKKGETGEPNDFLRFVFLLCYDVSKCSPNRNKIYDKRLRFAINEDGDSHSAMTLILRRHRRFSLPGTRNDSRLRTACTSRRKDWPVSHHEEQPMKNRNIPLAPNHTISHHAYQAQSKSDREATQLAIILSFPASNNCPR